MTLYLLIFEQDTDAAWGASVTPFLDQELARSSMRSAYEKTLKLWDFDESCQTDEHECSCQDDTAVIRDGTDVVNWRVEEHHLDVELAIAVKGGLVQTVYANTDVSPDVYDFDVSDFPDDGEQEAADAKEKELEQLTARPGWRVVW